MTSEAVTIEAVDRRGRIPSRAGEEELRFIRNFHDVFLSIGLALFITGLGFVSALTVAETLDVSGLDDVRKVGWIVTGVVAANAVAVWLLGEIFARSRRLFLPAIVILLAFAWYVALATAIGYVTMFGEAEDVSFGDAVQRLHLLPLVTAGVTTLAIFAYYARMKLPFAMGLGGVALAATGVAGLAYLDAERVASMATLLQVASGVFLFALGLFFDARDPERRTRLSDNGFWLHFFAAPLIFNGVMTMAVGSVIGPGATLGAGAASTTLAIVFVFALVSLLINRRALLVAGLLSAAVAVGVLVNRTGLGGAWTGALTLLLLGGAMVLLGGGWHWVRRRLVAPFPKEGLIARIIPPEPDPRDARAREAAEEGAAA